MTPVAPNLHTFDPQIAGMAGLSIDPAGLVVGNQVLWYAAATSGGSYAQIAATYFHSNLDALSLVFDGSGPLYCVAKVYTSSGTSPSSNEVSAAVSAGPPPPLTQTQHLQAALGGTYTAGDIVEVFPPTPTTSKTVNADGSIS